ncbi:MAG TPA: GlcNAc-PI de-N-acetylase, partial [Anaerolineae bacterium]|nr:GlcNAc-PI de-N-acetylase [Anaerolineae bacterium]
YKDVAEMRTDELLRATKILGLKEVYFLDYRDSGMPGTDDNKHPNAQVMHSVDEVAGKVVKYIRELKPDIVLTFDPIGGYKHPDHIHIQQATTLAFEKSDDASFHPESGSPFKPLALYYQVFPRWFLKLAVHIMPLFGRDPKKFGRNNDIDLTDLIADFPIHVTLNTRSVSEIKNRASAQHASQGGRQMRRGLMGLVTRVFGEREDYMQAYPPVNGRFRRKHDLFDGI